MWWLLTGALFCPRGHAAAFEDFSHRAPMGMGGGGDGLHGLAWLDYDKDGDLDLFVPNGPGQPSALLRNDGNSVFVDVADDAGVTVRGGISGVLAADFDGDGAVDLLALGDGSMGSFAQSRPWLFRNKGDGTFVDVAAASGVLDALPATAMGAATADIDGDGDLDIFVLAAGSIQGKRSDPNVLLRNDGEQFVNVAVEAGVAHSDGTCAAVFTHLNEDAAIDLVVARCLPLDFAEHPLQLFVNDGTGVFEDRAPAYGVWETGFRMGLSLGDFDGDCLLDIAATDLGAGLDAPHGLYLRRGVRFVDAHLATGMDPFEYGWGLAAADFDNDTDTDLIVAGSPRLEPLWEWSSPGHHYRNRGDGTFTDLALPLDLVDRTTAGVAVADWDNDGFVDVAIAGDADRITGSPLPPILLHNTGTRNRSITAIPVWKGANPAGIGARILAALPDGRCLIREVTAGSSFISTESPWPTFGLGQADGAHLFVRWPDGTHEAFGWVAAGTRLPLRAGTADPPGCGCRKAPPGGPWLPLLALLWCHQCSRRRAHTTHRICSGHAMAATVQSKRSAR